MTRKEAVVLASRVVAFYLICWAVSDITRLPQEIIAFRHHGTAEAHDWLWNLYRAELTFYVVRIVALFITAEWLIKCGEGIQKFFLPGYQITQQLDPESTNAPQY